MDMHLMKAQPSDIERAALDAVEALEIPGVSGAELRRSLVLPALHALNDAVGWITPGGLEELCERLDIAPAVAYGVASFYGLFSTQPLPGVAVHVCDDVVCATLGSETLCQEIEEALGPEGSPPDGVAATWFRSPCLGQCDRGPAALVAVAGSDPPCRSHAPAEPAGLLGAVRVAVSSRETHGVAGPVPARREVAPVAGSVIPGAAELTSEAWPPAAGPAGTASPAAGPAGTGPPAAGPPVARIIARVGRVDPGSLDSYRAQGGYAALRRAVWLGPGGVLAELERSRLLGRGGAAFPTGAKWAAVAREPARPHFVVANADESEPGTFKDRLLMEGDPFALVEALTIAGYATGSELGFVYVRGEYPLATARLEDAIGQARARGLLGGDVGGHGFAFDIHVRRGAGAYVCGEETALFNSIEGFRGEPRNKPPYPTTVGLFDKPTAVNNVETLCNVLQVIALGAEAYADIGTQTSSGTRLFCVSGAVSRPGVYEEPFGVTVAEVIDHAGGTSDGQAPRAVLLGGAAGAFIGPEDLDQRLSFESARHAGLSLGSGALIVFGHDADLPSALVRIARFFRDESCGQCVPCRVGTVRQHELLERLAQGAPLGSSEADLVRLDEIAAVMRDASICGLGQAAASAAGSALARLGVFDGGST